jgi:GntR family transcriptional repressor for pyruvate dehydrogenase complex
VREADRAQRLGLSRSSLREAVRALSLLRILDVRQGDGTYVTSLDPSQLLDAMSACESVEEFVENDIAFHHAIASASGNPVIAKLLDSLAGPTVRARVWRGITEGGAIDRTIAEHRSIYEALEQRRPELAASWMTVHLAWLQSAMP